MRTAHRRKRLRNLWPARATCVLRGLEPVGGDVWHVANGSDALADTAGRRHEAVNAVGRSLRHRTLHPLKIQDSPVKIDRKNSSRMVIVRGRDWVSFVADAQTVFNTQIKLPPNYRAT